MRVLNEGKGLFEQYTGAKDINGVEIYEGDIVMLVFPDGWGGYNDSKEIGQVSWNNAESRFEIYEYSGLLTTNAIQIIGNVHENPELLETK
jgi:YopX protein.